MSKKLLGLVFVLVVAFSALSSNPKYSENASIRLSSVENGLLPDITVRNLRYFNPDNLAQEIVNPIRGDRVVPQFTIENTGEEVATGFYINIEDLTSAVGMNPDGSIQFKSSGILVENLAPNESRDMKTIGHFIMRSQGGGHQWKVVVDPYETLIEHSDIDNIFNFNTPITASDWQHPTKDYLAQIPRMTPQNVVRNNANEVNRNGQFVLETAVQNLDHINGIDPVADTVTVALYINDREVARPAVALTSGRGTFSYTIRGSDFAVGEYPVRVVVDPANAIVESNERNNTILGTTLRVVENNAAGAIALPDFTITNVQYELYNQRGTLLSARDLRRGDIFYPVVTIRNIGTAPKDEIFYVDIEDRSRIAGVNNDGSVQYATQGIMFRGIGIDETLTGTTISPFILKGNVGMGDNFQLRFKIDPYEYTNELNENNNSYLAEIPMERIPFAPVTNDFLTYSVRWVPNNVIQQSGAWQINDEDTIRLSVRIDNADFVNRGVPYLVDDVPVEIRAGNIVRNVLVDFNDSSTEVEVSFTGRELGVGLHRVTVAIDPNDAFAESNPRNNIREFYNIEVLESGAYQYVPLPMPELSLESVQLKRLDANGWTDVTPEQLQRGDRFMPYVTVRNTGTVDPGGFYVIIEDQSRWMRDPNTNRLVGYETGILYNGIAPGESATGTTVSPFLITNTGSGPFLLKFRVDGYERVREMNENNNFSTFSIPRAEVPFQPAQFDFLVDDVRRTPMNVVHQDGSWHLNTNETLNLNIIVRNNDYVDVIVRNNDYVDADFLDHSVNNLPLLITIGNNFRQTITVNMPDGTNSTTVPFTILGSQLGVGNHEMRVHVDPENRFVETNKRNNLAPGIFPNVLVVAPPVAPNLKAISARFVQVEGNRYYPIITILNDSDVPVEHSFNTIIHNKSDYRGIDEYRDPRYGKVNKSVERLGAHETVELVADTLVITATEVNQRYDVWAQVDDSGFAHFDDIDESNETDNDGLFNIGSLLTAIPNGVAYPIVVAAPPAPAPTPTPDPVAPVTPVTPLGGNNAAPAVLPTESFKITTKLVAGVKSIQGTCTVSFLNNPKFTAYVNKVSVSATVSCANGKFELKLKNTLKAKDSLEIETTKGVTKTKSKAVMISAK